MQYTTITLARLQADPPLYRRLKATRRLNPVLRDLAADLGWRHRAWAEVLSRTDTDLSWRAGLAREFALEDLDWAIVRLRATLLPPEGLPDPAGEVESFDLDSAMAFLRSRTPPA